MRGEPRQIARPPTTRDEDMALDQNRHIVLTDPGRRMRAAQDAIELFSSIYIWPKRYSTSRARSWIAALVSLDRQVANGGINEKSYTLDDLLTQIFGEQLLRVCGDSLRSATAKSPTEDFNLDDFLYVLKDSFDHLRRDIVCVYDLPADGLKY